MGARRTQLAALGIPFGFDGVTNRSMVRAFIQARMTSTRFPGKVLAPLQGRPILRHVISRVAEVIPPDHITVVTSAEESDDPLASYIRSIGVSVFRGHLDNVFGRLQLCLKAYPCSWFFRVCGDSPLLDGPLLKRMLEYTSHSDIDLVTNVLMRTFPVGQSAEMLKAETFSAINEDGLSPEEKEHVTLVYYSHPEKFRIVNVTSSSPSLANLCVAVDTMEDLHRLERILLGGKIPERFGD